jgi:hypothetical protein
LGYKTAGIKKFGVFKNNQRAPEFIVKFCQESTLTVLLETIPWSYFLYMVYINIPQQKLLLFAS